MKTSIAMALAGALLGLAPAAVLSCRLQAPLPAPAPQALHALHALHELHEPLARLARRERRKGDRQSRPTWATTP